MSRLAINTPNHRLIHRMSTADQPTSASRQLLLRLLHSRFTDLEKNSRSTFPGRQPALGIDPQTVHSIQTLKSRQTTISILAAMEVVFAHTYLLLFGKLAVGGLVALAVPPFTKMEIGFYKSTAVVYLLAAYSTILGDAYLYLKYADLRVISWPTLVLWGLFSGLFSGYCATLFVDLPFLRARLFPAAVIAGVVALATSAWSYVPESAAVFVGLPFALAIVSGAAILGAATTGMLLGHWYLIESGLDLAPLHQIFSFCRTCLHLEIVVVCAGALLLWMLPYADLAEGFALATSGRFYMLIVARAATWTLALVIVALIGRTLAIPQTMAATGLFYMLALVVAVGQICGHWLLFRSGLPL